MANYTPPDPPQDILKTLEHPKSQSSCLHILYPSHDAFIDHLLWILHTKSSNHNKILQHVRVMIWRSLNNLFCCTNCINILLSKITFNNFINQYSIWRRNPSGDLHSKSSINSVLYAILFRHPKMYKIVMKTCKLNKNTFLKGEEKTRWNQLNNTESYVHNFDFVCDIVDPPYPPCVELSNIPSEYTDKYKETVKIGELIETMSALTMLRLSMKYWNKYHTLVFLRHYFLPLHEYFAQMLQKNLDDAIVHNINAVIGNIIQKLQRKCRKFTCKDIGNHKVHMLLTRYIKENMGKKINFSERRKEYKKDVKRFLTCSWIKCCKLQGMDANNNFKVCRRCKMAYYCSRQCQKRSWNTDHRNICHKLHNHYQL